MSATAVLLLVLAVVSVLLGLRILLDRAARKQRNLLSPWPIRAVSLADFDPVFRPGPFGPGLDTQVQFVGRGVLDVPGGTSDTEAWVLSVLSKRAQLMFEFGTCTGKTAYLWALNSSPSARIVTVTLAPEARAAYRSDALDDARDTAHALEESAFTRFMYSDTPVAGKVEQLFADSKSVDVSPWRGRCDLVFVDGSHAYSYVVSDSDKALELVRPGGVVLWHDYLGPKHSPGVYRGLNELAQRLPLVRLAGTSFVAYRRPSA